MSQEPPPDPAQAPPPGVPEATLRKRRTGLVVGVVAGLLALLCLGVIAFVVLVVGGEGPAGGDCATDASDPNAMQVVACVASDTA